MVIDLWQFAVAFVLFLLGRMIVLPLVAGTFEYLDERSNRALKSGYSTGIVVGVMVYALMGYWFPR